MKPCLALAFWILCATSGSAVTNPLVITVKDTINPGVADYILAAVREAEATHAPCLILELDTPGGLLTSTRQIIQGMLNAPIPIVVFVSPKGAQAGSAGALITFAADIAAMAPDSNIGAAHPVGGDGNAKDKTMDEKVTNDTAALAESLARTKGRNAEWARLAVTKSESIPADKALQTNVVDLISPDLQDLIKRISGAKLRTAKGVVTSIPTIASSVVTRKAMTVKQRVVSFFSNPNISYLLLSLGALCLWIELTHPGAIVPGVVGGLSLIISLVAFQTLPIDYGALALLLLGLGLLIAEMLMPSFGALGIGGIVCFVLGSLFLMDTSAPEFQISLQVILPTAVVLALGAIALGTVIWRSRRKRAASGVESLVGEVGVIKDAIPAGGAGRILIQGELWIAKCEQFVSAGAKARILAVQGMELSVEPLER